MCQHNLPCSIVYAHCLLPGRAFASLYVLLFLEKEAEIGGRDRCKANATFQDHVIYNSIRVRSISPESFERLSLNFTQMILSVRRCAEHMTQLSYDSRSQVRVKGFTLEFRVCSISPEPFRRISLHFIQMFLTVTRCAEHMALLHRLKVEVILQSHGMYPSIRVRSISPTPFERFSFNFSSNVPLNEVVCRTNDSLQTRDQGHTSRSWISNLQPFFYFKLSSLKCSTR